MEQSCPLFFALYPAHHLLPGLQEYLGDTTPLLAALELPTDSSNGRRKRPDRERSSSGLRNSPLVVGSRKLVFLHSTTSKWCRMKVGDRRRGGKEGVKGVGGGWSEEKETETETGGKWSKEKQTTAGKEATCFEGGVLVGFKPSLCRFTGFE